MKIILNGEVAEVGSGQNLTAGDGITIQDNSINVATPVKSVTQAEYDALTEEEKNTGLYVVTDANISLKDRGEVYSTEETRIGTWIDGKPIYRIAFSMISPSSGTNTWQKIKDVPNVNQVIKLDGIVDRVNDSVPLNLGTYCYLSFAENSINFYMQNSDYFNRPIRLIMEYTKTTDTGVTA